MPQQRRNNRRLNATALYEVVIFALFTKMYKNDHIRDLEMGRTCSKHGGEGKCISSSWGKPEGKRRFWRSIPLSGDDTKMSRKE